MHVYLNPSNVADYKTFLEIKRLPKYSFSGRCAWFPDEYAGRLGMKVKRARERKYVPPAWMFDYQRDITSLAIRKRKFAMFMDCGLGKTLPMLEFAKHAEAATGKRILMVSPLMVIEQTMAEAERFYGGEYRRDVVKPAELQTWLHTDGPAIGITNYEALRDDITPGNLGGLVVDESSTMKSHYGKWGTRLIEMGRGLEWKLAGTGTPAPNDRIEYANHAVFLDEYPTVNAFLARFFVNRGQTNERWELKAHALGDFYRSLSHWSIFLSNPATYGWKDNCGNIPPINVHIHDVPMTSDQNTIVQSITGELFASSLGGIMSRSTMGQIAKGRYKGNDVSSAKPEFIRKLVESFGNESTIVWCIYNAEQDGLAELLPNSASMTGDTPHEDRRAMIDAFKAGRIKTLISKAKVLGFGLNLQVATRHVFSGLQDSYESYRQCVKRSNRIGSTVPLNVHIPVTDVEAPMVDNVLRKAHLVEQDTIEQERIFKESMQ